MYVYVCMYVCVCVYVCVYVCVCMYVKYKHVTDIKMMTPCPTHEGT